MSRFTPHLFSAGRGFIAAALALLVVTGAVAAQSGGDDASRQVRRFLMEGLSADTLEERIEAVHTLELSGLPEAVDLMREGLDVVHRRRASCYARYLALGRKLTAATRRQATVPAKARARAEESARLAADLHDDEQLIAALRAAMGRAFHALPASARGQALAALAERIQRIRSRDARLELIESLGYLRAAAALELLQPFATSPEPLIRLVAVEALGRQGADAALLTLAKALEDPCWQVQAVAIEAIAAVGGVAAVDSLVRALPRVNGRLRHDVASALVALTGEDFRLNAVLWRRWWRDHKADYRGPPAASGTVAATGGEPQTAAGDAALQAWRSRTEGTSFYGIHSNSRSIVYVLDLSSSMNEQLGRTPAEVTPEPHERAPMPRKIDQALGQLRDSIAALADGARFNIVFYNYEVHAWRAHLITATQEHKRQAATWASGLRAGGNTNIFDALERAFALTDAAPATTGPAVPADTIYLLSDGRANRGRISDGVEMRREVRRLNRRRGVVIHTVALGADADLAFMQGLAEDSGGQSVHLGHLGGK